MKYKTKCKLHAIVNYIVIVLIVLVALYFLPSCTVATPATIIRTKGIPCSQYRVIVFEYDKFGSLPVGQQKNINIDNMAYYEYCVKK